MKNTFRQYIDEAGFSIEQSKSCLEQDFICESTETDDGMSDGETFDEWKTNAFKYIDKRLDVNKIKELGTYVKDFLKQEYDNGEPSWFMAAESIVNYARIKYPDALKDRSYATSITENAEPKTYRGYVDFISEDAAYDAMDIWQNVLKPKGITRENMFSPWSIKLINTANEMKNVKVEKTSDVRLTITASKKKLVDEAIEIFNEDEDSVADYKSAKLVTEAFIKDDSGKVSVLDLVYKILEKIGYDVDTNNLVTDAAYYIADFYSKQSLPVNGMVMWGSRDLNSFISKLDNGEKNAVSNTRSIMRGNPVRKSDWIENIKNEFRG